MASIVYTFLHLFFCNVPLSAEFSLKSIMEPSYKHATEINILCWISPFVILYITKYYLITGNTTIYCYCYQFNILQGNMCWLIFYHLQATALFKNKLYLHVNLCVVKLRSQSCNYYEIYTLVSKNLHTAKICNSSLWY